MKLQRTGLTEGTLIFNNWLKKFNLYRKDTEDGFIQWLYSSAGWYDKDIKGSYFNIDTQAVKKSEAYNKWLEEEYNSLKNSDILDLMLHSSYHVSGLEKKEEFTAPLTKRNYPYWRDFPFLKNLIKDKKLLVISSVGDLITEKYDIPSVVMPDGFFNNGPHKNGLETLALIEKLAKEAISIHKPDITLISAGPYGCILANRLNHLCDTVTIGSSIYKLFPIKIPKTRFPKNYTLIEKGKYWLNNGIEH